MSDNVNRPEDLLKRTLLVAAAATLTLAVAPAAQAAHDPLASGTTTLKLDAAVAKALSGAGVRVAPISPAKSGVRFPITGGTLDSSTARGTINHSGGLKFSAGGKSLSLRSFTVKLGKRSTLSGRVGSSRVTLLTLEHEPGEDRPRRPRHAHHRRPRLAHRRGGQGAQRHLLAPRSSSAGCGSAPWR